MMNVFFEKAYEQKIRVVSMRNVEHSWPTHFHDNIEIFVLGKGKYQCDRNGVSYTLTDNQLIIFDHYDLHSYKRLQEIENDCVVMIPMAMCKDFDAARRNEKIKNPVITDEVLVKEVLSIADEFRKSDDEYCECAAIGYILSLIYKKLEFTNTSVGNESEAEYIRRILVYISEHFREDITATSVAAHMGYSREYVSRLFNRYMKESMPQYINKKRIEYIEAKRKESNENLTDLILSAGFKHASSYYRFIKK